ncbi:uncharacterized protein LOC105227356 [Bactrocera dorsalis]|uniref:Uncharacterized protein LOC105227356 n=2 Tax=Bactrocera dorsalis TaxID=27457 RepID=A0A6I9V8C2_BACDO|nr:uncharacterized protein LOC105227356 [Bactrocera dorsalis]XP_019846481.1 uncharacterized protein LOC105227356 [Bactrocera dorsalis]
MRTQKDCTVLLFFYAIYWILFIECSRAKVNDYYEYGTPIKKRVRRSLTTICVEIKPRHLQEEPYLLCKDGKLSGFVQQVPYEYTKNNIFISNDRNFIPMSKYGEDKSNYVAQQPFLFFPNVQLNKGTFGISNFVNRYSQSTHSNSGKTTPPLNSSPVDQRLPTSMPFTLSTVKYEENNETPSRRYNFNNEYLKTRKDDEDSVAQLYNTNQSKNCPAKLDLDTEKWKFNATNDDSADSLQYLLNAPIQRPEIEMAPPALVKELPLLNDATGLASQQIFSEKSNRNQQYSAESLQYKLPYTTLWSQSKVKGQYDDFRKETLSDPEAPSNQYCKACPPETVFTLPPIIITLPGYNPSPEAKLSDSFTCYRPLPPTYNSPSYENFVCENQFLRRPETRELVGSSYNPLLHIFQTKLLPYFSMIPRIGGLLGSARVLLPTLHVTDRIYQSTTPIPEISRSNPLTYTSQPAMMPISKFNNDLRPHIQDDNVAVQLDNMQIKTLPMTTVSAESSDVDSLLSIKSFGDLQKGDNSKLQSQSQIRNFTTAKPNEITKPSTTEDWNQTSEEPTKKILTIIEKARRLQMRHRINSN